MRIWLPSLWRFLIKTIYSSKCKCTKFLESVTDHLKLWLLLIFLSLIGANYVLINERIQIIQRSLTEFVIFLAAYYLKYLKTPYFIFVRDSLSYLVLVVLHYAFCLSPSSLAFSGLEWSIFVFFMGRFLVEVGQVRLTVNRIKERRKSAKDETNSNVLKKALCGYIRWISLKEDQWHTRRPCVPPFFVKLHFDVICGILLNRHTTIWNLFVKLIDTFISSL